MCGWATLPTAKRGYREQTDDLGQPYPATRTYPRGCSNAIWLFRFLGSDEGTTARTDAAHLDDHSFAHLNKMRKVGGLRVEASGRQGLEQGGIRLLAISCVPGAG